MKHSLYFLIIITLLFAGCRQKAQSNFLSESSAQTEESNPSLEEYAEEAVITGKVLNRDFYPQEKELTLIIPFFRDMGNQYRSPIQKDGSFSFRFPVYAKLREVSIRNYAEHLYILSQYCHPCYPNDSSCEAAFPVYSEPEDNSSVWSESSEGNGTHHITVRSPTPR